MELANGVTTDYQYDKLNRLTNITHLNPAQELLASYTYTPAADGMRGGVAETQEQPGGQSEDRIISYDYDDNGAAVAIDSLIWAVWAR